MSHRTRKRVAPSEGSCTIEIRPGRHLRIQHFNARPRDSKFQNEMQVYIDYKKNGFQSFGPMSMPKKKSNIMNKNVSSDKTIVMHDVHPNFIVNRKESVSSIDREMTDVASPRFIDGSSLSSSVVTSPSHQTKADHIRSASSVHMCSKSDDNNVSSDNMKMTSNSNPQTQHSSSSHMQNGRTTTSSNSNTHDNDKNTASPFRNDNQDLALFFIHGVGGSSNIWSAQAEYFSSLGLEVIIPDLIGHGFSCTPRSAKAYHFKEIASDLETIFDLFCKRKNIVIGHSYGASFASHLARHRPRRVTKIVLVSGGPPTPLAPQTGVFSLPTCMLRCINPCLKRGFYKGAFIKTRTPILPKEEAFNIPTYVLQNTMNGQDWPEGDELFHSWLTCPVLLIHGAEDKFVTRQEEEDMCQTVFDCHLEVIEDASHMVMLEAPDTVNQFIHAFIITSTSSSLVGPFKNNSTAAAGTDVNTNMTDSARESNQDFMQRSKSRQSQRSLKSAKGLRRSHTQNLLRTGFKK